MPDNKKWCYAYSEEGAYYGPFDTRQECIDEARSEVEPGESFWIGNICPIDIRDHEPCELGEKAIESVCESIGEVIGENVQAYEESLYEHREALSDVITEAVVAYIKEHCPPDCFSVENAERVDWEAPDALAQAVREVLG